MSIQAYVHLTSQLDHKNTTEELWTDRKTNGLMLALLIEDHWMHLPLKTCKRDMNDMATFRVYEHMICAIHLYTSKNNGGLIGRYSQGQSSDANIKYSERLHIYALKIRSKSRQLSSGNHPVSSLFQNESTCKSRWRFINRLIKDLSLLRNSQKGLQSPREQVYRFQINNWVIVSE